MPEIPTDEELRSQLVQAHQKAWLAQRKLDRIEKLVDVLEKSWPAAGVLLRGALER